MPVHDDDLAAARASIEQARRRLAEHSGTELENGAPSDEQVAQQALWIVFERNPDELSDDELREMFRRLFETVVEIGESEVIAPRVEEVLHVLDGRGVLAGTAQPPSDRPARRAWATERIGALGGLAWRDGIPLWLRAWFKERAVATLRDAGDDGPPQSALRKHCAMWSWSYGDTAEIFAEAFPAPPEELARHDPAVVFAGQVARRIRQRDQEGRADDAESLRRAAVALFGRWFDESLDPVEAAAHTVVKSLLAPP